MPQNLGSRGVLKVILLEVFVELLIRPAGFHRTLKAAGEPSLRRFFGWDPELQNSLPWNKGDDDFNKKQ